MKRRPRERRALWEGWQWGRAPGGADGHGRRPGTPSAGPAGHKSRRETAARELARACGAQVIARKYLVSACFEAIVNTTPVGMYPQVEVSPLLPNELNCEIVMDLIYRPLRTKLLRIAAEKGIRVVSGVEMLLAQGFAQWELWLGRAAPEAAMRRVVMAKLRSEEAAHGRRSVQNR